MYLSDPKIPFFCTHPQYPYKFFLWHGTWWMTMKEERNRKVTQHQHTTQKGLEVRVKFEWVINNIHRYLVMQMNWSFFVMLMDSQYVVMQLNWPFLVTGESQLLS